MNGEEKRISKQLSYVLRHGPESIGIVLEKSGWVPVDVLLSQMAKFGNGISREELDSLVANNSKQRFEFSENGSKIRARQGHSVAVDLEYEPRNPPEVLYHGTAEKFLESILAKGLLKQGRHHVHLSTNRETMLEVGRRHGKAVLLEIDCARMHDDGLEFFLTANNVWLTDSVPAQYLKVL